MPLQMLGFTISNDFSWLILHALLKPQLFGNNQLLLAPYEEHHAEPITMNCSHIRDTAAVTTHKYPEPHLKDIQQHTTITHMPIQYF